LTSEASLADVQLHVRNYQSKNSNKAAVDPSPIMMSSFRPNIVIGPATALPSFDEDCWSRVRIGNTEFHLVKPCARCTIPTVVPSSGTRRIDGEPLRTLRRYRMKAADKATTTSDSNNRPPPSGPFFGQNMIHQSIHGTIRVGDPIVVLERKTCSVPTSRK
jgi:uncharacterized protein YcbX